MSYYWIKVIHVSTVVFTAGFFALRFYWMLSFPHLLTRAWIRILSVSNDTLLLIAGITLAIKSHQYPFQASWLTAKLIALVLYIILGSLALKRAETRRARGICGILALICVGYIIAVALNRTPTPWPLAWN